MTAEDCWREEEKAKRRCLTDLLSETSDEEGRRARIKMENDLLLIGDDSYLCSLLKRKVPREFQKEVLDSLSRVHFLLLGVVEIHWRGNMLEMLFCDDTGAIVSFHQEG